MRRPAGPALLLSLLAAMALAGCGDDGGDSGTAETAPGTPAAAREAIVPRAIVNRFNAGRAFAEARFQVRMGERPAGSSTSRRLAARIKSRIPRGRYESVPAGLRNVVGRLPGRRPAILLGAHYDTKDIPGFVGANDGAGGTAVLLELARVLRRERRPRGAREIRFVFFDGEESPDDDRDFYETGLRGSKAYARAHRSELREAIVIDFVADKKLSLPREEGSNARLWSALRAAARRVGVGAVFPNRTVGQILDDHTPFARAGIPAIDLIDFTYPPWHTTADTLDKISARSMDAAGEALVELVRARD
jgi:glutaminyl-peptide cyclotransferase